MTSTGRNRTLQLPVQTSEMYGAFSPDRSRLLTGGDGPVPKVHIWDAGTGNLPSDAYRTQRACCSPGLDRGSTVGGFGRLRSMRSPLGRWLGRASSHFEGSSVVCPIGALQPVWASTTVWGRGRNCLALGVARRKAASGIRGSHGWRLSCRFRPEPDSSPIRWTGRDDQAVGDQHTALLAGHRRAGSSRPLSKLACGRATVPFLRRRYPALGLGKW